jgi:hypothetical protein
MDKELISIIGRLLSLSVPGAPPPIHGAEGQPGLFLSRQCTDKGRGRKLPAIPGPTAGGRDHQELAKASQWEQPAHVFLHCAPQGLSALGARGVDPAHGCPRAR